MTEVQGRCPAFEGLRETFSKSSLRTLAIHIYFRINPAINALVADFYYTRYLLWTEIQIK